MPIRYRVDAEAHAIVVVGHGSLTDEDVFGYQREIGSRPELADYDELVDMTRVTGIELPSASRVQDLAVLAARTDREGSAPRLSVVAPTDFAYGLGRMFQAHRELDPKGSKKVGVFRTMEEALDFLGRERPLVPPEIP